MKDEPQETFFASFSQVLSDLPILGHRRATQEEANKACLDNSTHLVLVAQLRTISALQRIEKQLRRIADFMDPIERQRLRQEAALTAKRDAAHHYWWKHHAVVDEWFRVHLAGLHNEHARRTMWRDFQSHLKTTLIDTPDKCDEIDPAQIIAEYKLPAEICSRGSRAREAYIEWRKSQP